MNSKPRVTKPFKKSNPTAQKKYDRPEQNKDLPDPKQRKIEKRQKKSLTYACDMGELLQLFEKARQDTCENRQQLLDKAFPMLSRNFKAAALSNTESRILALYFQYSTVISQKEQIVAELKPCFFQVCTSKYGHHLAIKMLNVNTKTPEKYVIDLIETEILPNLIAYASQVQSIQIVNHIFINSNSYKQKILNQICGNLTTNEAQFTKNLKPVMKLINTALSKDLIASPLIQKLMLTVFQAYPVLLAPETKSACEFEIKAISGQIDPKSILLLIDKPDGIRVACAIYCLQTPKEKQQIVNSLKDKFVEICLDPIASGIVFQALQNTDDTKFLTESILTNLKRNYGKMDGNLTLLQFICSGMASGKIFNGNVQLLANLTIGNGLWGFCKKEQSKRVSELVQGVKNVFGEILTQERLFELSLEFKDNAFLNVLLSPEQVAQNYCRQVEKEEGATEYAFRHNVAHYGLIQYIKWFKDAEFCKVMMVQLLEVPAENFVKRGAFLLKALSLVDKEGVKKFIVEKGVDQSDVVIKSLME